MKNHGDHIFNEYDFKLFLTHKKRLENQKYFLNMIVPTL